MQFLKPSILVLLLLGSITAPTQGQNRASIKLTVDPATKHFRCRFRLRVQPDSANSPLVLNLNRHFPVLSVSSPRMNGFSQRPYLYPAFQDTLLGLHFSYPGSRLRTRRIKLTYEGTLTSRYATDQAMEFSRHTLWLPFLPNQEDAPLDYSLQARVPNGYSVVSTRPATGKFRYRGRTAAIEPTVLVSKQFRSLDSGPAIPRIEVVKTSPLLATDTLLLAETKRIVGFYNQGLGRRDAITTFKILLPGTNRDAFGLLDNAVDITYSDFDVRKPGDRLILAHEISHKWWAYGSVSNADEWLNEGFAVYSSLLYLRATGDTAAFRQQLAVHQQAAQGAPAIIGLDRHKHDYKTLRRVIYSKGATVLAALHGRIGDERFMELLARTAAQKTATTEALLGLVGQATDAETRRWLTTELSR